MSILKSKQYKRKTKDTRNIQKQIDNVSAKQRTKRQTIKKTQL